VADMAADALAAKGKRVAGVFVLMSGAGLILESSAVTLGAVITVIGTLVFAWGMLEARTRAPSLSDAQRVGSRP